MNTAEFWALIDESRSAFDPALRDGNLDRQVERLEEVLGRLSPEELVQFEATFQERMREAYRWDLWGAAYILEGGCSDDGFTDFRAWLISMGRSAYEQALRDPETLVETAGLPGVEVTRFEEFQYVPRLVYERLTGAKMPNDEPAPRLEPVGERWSDDGDDLQRRFPKLWASFWV